MKDAQGTVLQSSHYTYDPFNNRIGASVNNGSGDGADLDGLRWLEPLRRFEQYGQVTHRYLRAAVDAVLADVSTSGSGSYLLGVSRRTGLGTRRGHAQGSVIDHIQYDPFGNILSESNPSNGDRFKYAQQQADATGLNYDRRATTTRRPAGSSARIRPVSVGAT